MTAAAEAMAGSGTDSHMTVTNILYGGNGNDTMEATAATGGEAAGDETATNTLHGGDGNDVMTAAAVAKAAFGTQPHKTVTNSLYGGNGNDTMEATATASGEGNITVTNTLCGGFGGDVLMAEVVGDGSSTVRGGADGDTLTVIGGQGNVLEGGAGDDTMTGGACADTFLYDSSTSGNLGNDTVLHFQQGIDIVELMGYAAAPTIEGNVATLSDGTTITFDDLAGIEADDFVIS
jgi:Ca2+-binding RTX toxin-like protein